MSTNVNDEIDDIFSEGTVSSKGTILPRDTKKVFNRIFGYSRTSTTNQLEGISISVQTQRITEWAQERHIIPIILADEAKSGGKLVGRDSLKAILKNLSANDVLVSVSSDRLGRNVEDVQRIVDIVAKKKAFIVYLNSNIGNDTTDNKLMLTIGDYVSAKERDKVKEKTKDCMTKLKEDNELRHRPPFGKRVVAKDKPCEDDPEELEVVNLMRKLFALNPDIKDNEMARFLNDHKQITKSRRGKWYCNSVRAVRAYYDIYPPDILKREDIAKIHDKFVNDFYGGRNERTGRKRIIPTISSIPSSISSSSSISSTISSSISSSNDNSTIKIGKRRTIQLS